jgi:hypothetical protein
LSEKKRRQKGPGLPDGAGIQSTGVIKKISFGRLMEKSLGPFFLINYVPS